MFQLVTIEDMVELQSQQLDDVQSSVLETLAQRYQSKVSLADHSLFV